MKYRFSEYIQGEMINHDLNIQALFKCYVRKAWKLTSGQKYQTNTVDAKLNLADDCMRAPKVGALGDAGAVAEKGEPEQWTHVRLLFVRGNADDSQGTTGKHDWAVFQGRNFFISLA